MLAVVADGLCFHSGRLSGQMRFRSLSHILHAERVAKFVPALSFSVCPFELHGPAAHVAGAAVPDNFGADCMSA
jgi:hypothetical protein